MCYTYDEFSRVTKRTTKDLNDTVLSEESFTYDLAGNITGGSANTAFVYDTNNRLVVFNGENVMYDADGNMTAGNNTCFGYDSLNRLIYAGDHDYTYNAENVRIRNLCTDDDTTYVYNINCKLSQLLVKTTNGVTTKYVYGRGLIGEETNNVFKTYHFDSRGSTIAITDMSGNVTDTFAYDTYGKLISRTGTSDVIFGYNGRDGVVTDDNGLIYMRARYYSPEMRRFVNADIIAGEISNAITLNRYAYANGNPVSFVDPLGLYICQSCGDAGCKICLDEDTLFKVLSGEIPNPNKQASSSNSGSSKSGGSVSTCFDDDENGQVINKNDYYGVPATPNKPQQERDYEAEAIEAINNAVDTADDNISDDFLEKNVPKTYSLPKKFEDFFGSGVVLSQTYKSMEAKTILVGYEYGGVTSKVIFGDISKPISIYVKNASEWWRIWEYKVGLQVNVGNGGFNFEVNVLEVSATISAGGGSFEFMSGINKVGVTISEGVDFGNRTAESYFHAYIRTIPAVALIGLAAVSGGAAIPVAATSALA